jgi:L-ascorbate metabolism protein UlaG (beta-lactamase superfamily)
LLSLLIGLVAAAPAAAQDGKVEVLWLGHAAVKITSVTGKVILIDPFIAKNPTTPERHRDLGALGPVDLILVTHAHSDHLGDAPALAEKYGAPVWAPAGLGQSLMTLGVVPEKLVNRFNKSGIVTPLGPDIKITMTRAEHSSELVWTDPVTGRERTFPGGEPAGFIIEFENGFKVYHMGDTGLFGDMRLIADYYGPDLILIPIGGHYTMDPVDAAFATKEFLKPAFAIPIHYGTIPVLKGTPEQYIEALGETTTKVFAVKPGETRAF